jgi:hypothetical protein
MAIVIRNGRPRMQRSVRVGGKVTTRYVSTGRGAELIAEADRMLRAQRADRHALDRDAALLQAAEDRLQDETIGAVVKWARTWPAVPWRRPATCSTTGASGGNAGEARPCRTKSTS